jgi:hypothetical protein
MRSLLNALSALIVLFVASGCLVETEATLGDPDPKTADARLLGVWYYASKSETTVISIKQDDKDAGAYRVVLMTANFGLEPATEITQYRIWRTIVNGRSILNVQRTDQSKALAPRLTLIRYEFGANGKLYLRMLNSKAAAAAVERGALAGTVTGQYTDEVKLTSPRAALVAFFGSPAGDATFGSKADGLTKMPLSKD